MSLLGDLLDKVGLKESPPVRTFRAYYRRRQALRLLSRDAGTIPRAATRVLAINHFFHGELKALAAAASEFPELSILPVDPEPFFSELLHHFPNDVRNAGIEYDHPSISGLRHSAREISRRVFSDISAAFPFNCVLTPSDSFYWLREFIHVCRENGIPVIVADKEGTISPASYKTDPPRIRRYYPPISDYFLVWSERQRVFWQKAGVPDSSIKITGAARSDIFVNMKRRPPRTVIFFDFDLRAYLDMVDWSVVNWAGERSWKYLRDGFRRAAARVAAAFPHVEVILKCHPQQVSKDFGESGLDKLGNVRIITGAEISELMPDAYAVAGFQTTALMEAAMAKIPVFYSAWGALFEIVKPEMLPFHEPGFGMSLCSSEEEVFRGVSAAILSGGKTDSIDAHGLELYFNLRDGRCSARILSELSRLAKK